MQFHGIKMMGPFIDERVTALPSLDDPRYEIASLVYHIGDNVLYVRTPTGWKSYATISWNRIVVETAFDFTIPNVGNEIWINVTDANLIPAGEFVFIGGTSTFFVTQSEPLNLRIKCQLIYSPSIGIIMPAHSSVYLIYNVPYAITLDDFTVPGIGSTVTIRVSDSSSYIPGENISCYTQTGTAYFSIESLIDRTHILAKTIESKFVGSVVSKYSTVYHNGFACIDVRNVEPVGTKDGSNTHFQVPDNQSFLPGTLCVYLNGLMYGPDSIVQNFDYKTFDINSDILPESDDIFTIIYTVGK